MLKNYFRRMLQEYSIDLIKYVVHQEERIEMYKHINYLS